MARFRFEQFTSSPAQLLRWGGVIACLFDGAFTVGQRLRSPKAILNLGDAICGNDFSLEFLVATDTLSFGIAAATFWYLTQERHVIKSGWLSLALLTLQSMTMLGFSPGINYISIAQAGFVLSPRMGLWWLAGQSAFELAHYSRVPAMAERLLPPHLQGLEGWLFAVAAAGTVAISHLMAYSLGVWAATAVRQKRELARRNAELEATQQIEADAARLSERLAIARDLHDELGHHLTGLSLNLQLASRQTEGPAKATIDQAYLLARTALSDIRNAVTDMRETQAVQLPKALETLTKGIVAPQVHLEIGEAMESVDPLPSHAIFRSAQEIVTNAVRHSHAANLWIELARRRDSYVLEARDDGRGAAQLTMGNGLRGMVERIENLGGRVAFDGGGRRPGFSLRIELPCKGNGAA